MNPYFSYFLSSISEIIGYSICYLNDKYGKKRMFSIYLIVSCVSFAGVGFIPANNSNIKTSLLNLNSILTLLFVSLGKASISAAFNTIYVYCSQFYPMRFRSTMILVLSSIGRIGGIISPQINLLGQVLWSPLPYLIFSLSAFVSIMSVCVLSDPDGLDNFKK